MKWFAILGLLILSFTTFGQVEQKHPRVVELEEKLEGEASKYFSQRFPGQPYFTKVTVTPLRSELKKGENRENLPYLEYESENDVDEWDDPSVTISYLRNRVKKIQIEVSVSNELSNEDLQEIKDSLNIFLKLIPYRDEIKVERKLTKKQEIPQELYYVATLLLVTLFGIGLWVRSSVKTIAENSKISTSSSGAGVSAAGAGSMSSSMSVDNNLNVKNVPPIRGDINFFDPIKLQEVLHLKIKQVSSNSSFPTLNDIMILERLADESPGVLGALIGEFPLEVQKSIFQLGRSQKWLEGFAFPTQVDQRCFQVLEEMNRSRELRKIDRDWENLLIQLWRTDEKIISFLREINPEHAFVILAQLPKTISLRAGKKVFPGSWGRVLEDRVSNVIIEPNLVKEYLKKAQFLQPLLDYKVLESYKKEKEILEYVKLASVEDERDIYETLSQESFIVKTRAPFYKVFETEDNEFKAFSEQFSHMDWALALINSSRQYIKRYADTLDEKKKYVFSVALKKLDDQPPRPQDQVEIKEKIASAFALKQQKESPSSQDDSDEETKLESKTA